MTGTPRRARPRARTDPVQRLAAVWRPRNRLIANVDVYFVCDHAVVKAHTHGHLAIVYVDLNFPDENTVVAATARPPAATIAIRYVPSSSGPRVQPHR